MNKEMRRRGMGKPRITAWRFRRQDWHLASQLATPPPATRPHSPVARRNPGTVLPYQGGRSFPLKGVFARRPAGLKAQDHSRLKLCWLAHSRTHTLLTLPLDHVHTTVSLLYLCSARVVLARRKNAENKEYSRGLGIRTWQRTPRGKNAGKLGLRVRVRVRLDVLHP